MTHAVQCVTPIHRGDSSASLPPGLDRGHGVVIKPLEHGENAASPSVVLGLSQQDIASQLEISQQTVNRVFQNTIRSILEHLTEPLLEEALEMWPAETRDPEIRKHSIAAPRRRAHCVFSAPSGPAEGLSPHGFREVTVSTSSAA